MDWLEITLFTAPEGIEEVAAVLTAEGFDDLVIEDQTELESFLDRNRAYWDYIDEALQDKLQGLSQIKLYIEKEDTSAQQRLQALVQRLKQEDGQGHFGSLEMKISQLPQTDWEESWKENYPPQKVGKSLVVIPYWLADTTFEDRKPVILDPGLTFGTGAHPSTQMVMEQMEALPLTGARCLDLGSGSGILSIVALRLGAKQAIGVDIDPKAEDIARENAAYNGFEDSVFTAVTGNVLGDRQLMAQLSEKQYDLVLVNIVADVIIALAPVLKNFLNEKSVLLLSGILDTRLSQVVQALNNAGITVEQICQKEEWRCIRGRRTEK